jgi:hypothetical protein
VIEVEKADILMPKEGNPEARKAKQCPLEINRLPFGCQLAKHSEKKVRKTCAHCSANRVALPGQ